MPLPDLPKDLYWKKCGHRFYDGDPQCRCCDPVEKINNDAEKLTSKAEDSVAMWWRLHTLIKVVDIILEDGSTRGQTCVSSNRERKTGKRQRLMHDPPHPMGRQEKVGISAEILPMENTHGGVMKAEDPHPRSHFVGNTWLEPEELCYPNGAMNRRCKVT